MQTENYKLLDKQTGEQLSCFRIEKDFVNKVQIVPSLKEKQIIEFIILKELLFIERYMKNEKVSQKLGIYTCNTYDQCRINIQIYTHAHIIVSPVKNWKRKIIKVEQVLYSSAWKNKYLLNHFNKHLVLNV